MFAPTPQAVVANFGLRYMPEVEVVHVFGFCLQGPPRAEGIPRYEDRTDHDQTFAVWFLRELSYQSALPVTLPEGQLTGASKSIERALDSEAGCEQVMHLIAGVRGAIAGNG